MKNVAQSQFNYSFEKNRFNKEKLQTISNKLFFISKTTNEIENIVSDFSTGLRKESDDILFQTNNEKKLNSFTVINEALSRLDCQNLDLQNPQTVSLSKETLKDLIITCSALERDRAKNQGGASFTAYIKLARYTFEALLEVKTGKPGVHLANKIADNFINKVHRLASQKGFGTFKKAMIALGLTSAGGGYFATATSSSIGAATHVFTVITFLKGVAGFIGGLAVLGGTASGLGIAAAGTALAVGGIYLGHRHYKEANTLTRLKNQMNTANNRKMLLGYTNGTYEGAINDNKLPHGEGVLIHHDGATYTGTFENGNICSAEEVLIKPPINLTRNGLADWLRKESKEFEQPKFQLAEYDLSGNLNLSGIRFSGADLEKANLRYANLKGANLEGANLEGANLEGANLKGANLKDANLENANLEGADLTKVIKSVKKIQDNIYEIVYWDHTVYEGTVNKDLLRDGRVLPDGAGTLKYPTGESESVIFPGSRVDDELETWLHEKSKESQQPRFQLAGYNLSHLNLREVNFYGANLEGASLKGAYLENANLEGADLEKADLENADLEKANLKDANLKGANLEKANLKFANLKFANLEKANLRGADFKDANLENVDLSRV